MSLFAFMLAAAAAQLLAPSSKWNVDYSKDMCVLLRNFGEGADKVTIGFKPSPMAETVRVIIVSDRGTTRPASGKGNIAFGGSHPNVDVEFRTSVTDRTQVTTLSVQRAELAPLLQGSPLAISARNRVNVAVRMDNFAGAWRALEACERDLLKSWGMTDAGISAIAKKPTQIKGTGIIADDYPDEAVFSGQQGTAGARLSLGADGLVVDCKLIESSGYPLIDQATCDALKKRARFEPALDGQGKPVPTLIYYLVNWQVMSSGIDYVKSSPPAAIPGQIN